MSPFQPLARARLPRFDGCVWLHASARGRELRASSRGLRLNVHPISSAVRALVTQHIRSVGELECILLLQRDAMRDWSAADLGRELRIDEQWAMHQLVDLTGRGFVAANETSSSPRYRYAPATAALDESVRQLAIDYAERRVSVIELIYAKPDAANPLQSFADAFRIRKEPPGV